MTRVELKPGIFFTAIEGGYKKSRLSVALITPLRRETVTDTAVLPYMLERGTRSCPDMTALKRRLCALYGTAMTTSYATFGFSRIVECVMSGADGSLLPDGDKISAERAALLLDVLLDPHFENGLFDKNWLEIEREKQREAINALINDKMGYCYKLLNEEFFKADERALPTDGFAQDLDGITPERLTAVYRELVGHCTVEILYVGPDAAMHMQIAREAAERFSLVPAARRAVTPVLKNDKPVDLVVPLEIEQDKLALAYTTGEVLGRREQTVLKVACALFGGTATSRLFKNVREKQSLCYSISAMQGYESGGGMYVGCGVEHADVQRTREAIGRELENFVQDGPSAEELEQVKLLYRSVLGGLYDNSNSIAKYEFNSILRTGDLTDPAEELALIESVSAQEAAEMLGRMRLNCSCLLCRKEGV